MMTSDHRLQDIGPEVNLSTDEIMLRLEAVPLGRLMEAARALTRAGHGPVVSYSRKVFIPLTKLCRDVCHYCTFAQAPREVAEPYLSIGQALEIARAGAKAGCKEALFTLGDQPELRYDVARRFLDEAGCASTLAYLEKVARAVFEETGLLPHLNPGIMSREDIASLRSVSVSMGLMLESASQRLAERGGPHWGSPDKAPAVRLETLRIAGELRVPFTTGLLIGIGETRRERVEALIAIRTLHETYGHIQEIIIQNFRAKPGTRMAEFPEPPLEEQLWTIAVARLLFGPEMTLQAPPNLQPDGLAALLEAGVNDWGGVSPVTPDHVNPEAPWPHLAALEEQTAAAGGRLVERLAIGPAYVQDVDKWVDPKLKRAVRHRANAFGRARRQGWFVGAGTALPEQAVAWLDESPYAASNELARVLSRAASGSGLEERDIVALFAAEGPDLAAVLRAADGLRQETVGPQITYVVNRNINYTNICLYHCGFCAFSKGGGARDARGPVYNLDLEDVGRRASEAWNLGATEVCLQGGIHPGFTGETYLRILDAVKEAAPDIHVHAFSPLEIWHGATTLGLELEDYLRRLKARGLSSLPGTAAEILDDEVRAIICPDKLTTAQWLEVMEAAHRVGLRSTATIMYGHVDHPRHWARHLLRVRGLQERTGGFTEFVPLPFVHMEAPIWRKGLARSGPELREAVLMHAVARLVLHPLIANIQTSWVKMGADGAALCLRAGANDLGGVLMNESITRAAGGVNGQLMDQDRMIALAKSIGRPARQRTTFYRTPVLSAQAHRARAAQLAKI